MNKLLNHIRTELGMSASYILFNIRAAAEQRLSFVLQILGMAINNTAFVIGWVMFTSLYPQGINGWGTWEVIALQGYIALVYGIVFSAMAGASELKRAINIGTLDSMLLTPRDVYFRVFTLSTKTSATGDLLYGIVLLALYTLYSGAGLVGLGVFLLFLIPSVLIMANILLVSSCAAFFITDSESISKSLFEIFFSPSMYPSGGFRGVTRFVLLFIIPSITIGGLPVELASHPQWQYYVLVWALGILWTYIGWLVLHFGIRHYESGNLTGAQL